MLKKCVSLTVKIVSTLEDPPPDPRVATPAYYYNFVEFVSSAMRFITLKKK